MQGLDAKTNLNEIYIHVSEKFHNSDMKKTVTGGHRIGGGQ